MENNPFKKYYLYERNLKGEIVSVNQEAIGSRYEAFELFKELYDTSYGTIEEDDNLVVIHTGGWSENELLVRWLKETAWWFMYLRAETSGGHYYFNTDRGKDKDWKITKGS